MQRFIGFMLVVALIGYVIYALEHYLPTGVASRPWIQVISILLAGAFYALAIRLQPRGNQPDDLPL